MSDNLNDRPFLLLILKVMRMMLWCCVVSLLVVGGAIWYSVTSVQGRAFEAFTRSDVLLFSTIGVLIVVAVAILIGVSAMIRQAARTANNSTG